jgi:hypothetical protein
MHARSLKQEVLPKAPESWIRVFGQSTPLLFTGSIRRFLSNRIVSGNKPRNQHLFWSIAQVKRCASVVPDSFVQLSLEKHRAAMLKGSEKCSEGFLVDFDEKLERIVEKISFRGVTKVHDYSTNACFENGMAKGGAAMHLQRRLVREGFTSRDELLKMDFCPYKGVTERRGLETAPLDHLLSMEDEVSKCRAKVYSICEPLKIRNITASNALPYAISKGMQHCMHSSLKALPAFRLIGSPLTVFVVDEFLSKLDPAHSIASGDFSAATDNIKIELTKRVFERILLKMSTDRGIDASGRLISYLRRVLYEHVVEYPRKSGLLPAEQQNGQLMGSVLSFPILCIINLITYWISVEPMKNLDELNVLVNGDDIMFGCNRKSYQDWLTLLPEAGLTPSPGKNFFHKKFGTVNSALFFKKKNECAEYVPFFNAGMLLGQSKVARVEEGRFKPIHCLHQSVLHGALNPVRADSRFKFYNLDALNECSILDNGTRLNWYLPRSMGGLGMKLPEGSQFVSEYDYHIGRFKSGDVVVTNEQRKIAYALRDLWYREDLTEPPFKPIGMPTDLDLENWGSDIRKRIVYQAQLRGCPQLPYCEDVVEETHPPNWYMRCTGAVDSDVMQFDYSGLLRIVKKVLRTSKSCQRMLEIENPHMYDEVILYKRRANRVSMRLVCSGEVPLDVNGICQIEYLLTCC